MATYYVTPDNWTDPDFWQSVTPSNLSTLDMSALGEGFSFSFRAGQRIEISDGFTTFTIGKPGDTSADANIGSGNTSAFDNIIAPTSDEGNFYRFGGDRQNVEMSDGDDTISLAGGHDYVEAGGGNDSVVATSGNDTFLGGEGDDTLRSGAGDDVLDGGTGSDILDGGAGNDLLKGGEGADLILGGDGSDTIADVGFGDTIDGGAGGDDADVLDLTGTASDGGSLKVITSGRDSDGNGFDGVVEYFDADGNLEGTLEFSNVETIVPCFTAGTRIATLDGLRAVEDLNVGDRILTYDNGYQPIRWIGKRSLTASDIEKNPGFAPIRFHPGSLGAAGPDEVLIVSPQHRLLHASARADMIWGSSEVLLAACHLTHLEGVDILPPQPVTYVHFLFDNHEIVLSYGVWTESFQPGNQALAGLGATQRAEVFALFPDLAANPAHERYPAARHTLKRHEVQLITV